MDKQLVPACSELAVDYEQRGIRSKAKELTILLLGETGVGKSTFINAFVNYLLFENLDEAAKNMRCVIPTQFTIYDDVTNEPKKCFLGDDPNENPCGTESATRAPKCHKLEVGEFILQIIDTPGIGDTKGVDADKRNMMALFEFIKEYKEINAICILLKPNNSRVTVVFQYCIMELLKHLNKSAARNIIFLFTNCRGTFYRVGDTQPALMEVLNGISKGPSRVNIAFNANTTYCFDNEAFRYLVAISEPNNIRFDDDIRKSYKKSWRRSVEQCDRLMKYIAGLRPHIVQDTISVNNARQSILMLVQPLGDITKNIDRNIKNCENQKKILKESKNNVEELTRNLFIPITDIESEQLDEPITVCLDPKCCEKKNVGGVEKEHYLQVCHSPCYLTRDDGSVVGNKGLLDCQAFNKYTVVGEEDWFDANTFYPDLKLNYLEANENGQLRGVPTNREPSEICFRCHHSYETHAHKYYKTKLVNRKERDNIKFKQINNIEQAIKAKKELVDELENKIKEYQGESEQIAKISAIFAVFLKDNAIVPVNDVIEKYIDFLIQNEEQNINQDDYQANMKKLKDWKKSYEAEKKIINDRIARAEEHVNSGFIITAEEIDRSIQTLYDLKHTGKDIRKHMEAQKSARTKVHQGQCQVVHKLEKSSVRGLRSFFHWFRK